MSELTPYVCVAGARAAIEWYQQALGAAVVFDPIEMDDGSIGHVELAVDGARWMMSDPFVEAGVGAPVFGQLPSVSLHLTVADCDAVVKRACDQGARLTRKPEDSPPAGRVAVFIDPYGHRWFINQLVD